MNTGLQLLILAVGLLTGSIATWLVCRAKTAAVKAEGQSTVLVLQEKLANEEQKSAILNDKVNAAGRQIEQLSKSVQEEKIARATAEQACTEIPTLREQLSRREQDAKQLQEEVT